MEAILDVEQRLVWHMTEAAKCLDILIHEAPEDLELTGMITARERMRDWCESIRPSKPDYGGENVVPISNHPRFRVAG